MPENSSASIVCIGSLYTGACFSVKGNSLRIQRMHRLLFIEKPGEQWYDVAEDTIRISMPGTLCTEQVYCILKQIGNSPEEYTDQQKRGQTGGA